MQKNVYILGGGTFNHVRAHLALAAPAFGETARNIYNNIHQRAGSGDLTAEWRPHLMLTKMADHTSKLVTNEDVSEIVDAIIADPTAKMVFFNVALCDFTGSVNDVDGEKYADRLKSREGPFSIELEVADKLIGRIRKHRKDIFLIGFKTTAGVSEDDQYIAGLNLLKANSCNLVLANDIFTRKNMIIVPEEARYCVTTDRSDVIHELVTIAYARADLHFTRSTVVKGDSVDWNGTDVPDSLRTVVNHCIQRGAYKPFRGSTAGHFAFKVDEKTFITSKRKTNFNELDKIGMVKVVAENTDNVIAYGAKPSVGGQSQRIIFKEHDDVDCIVHFHCPLKNSYTDIRRFAKHTAEQAEQLMLGPWLDTPVPKRPQKLLECGSHECGKNTSDGLRHVMQGIKAVYLDEHGPNIVFNRNIDPKLVISFIETHFDLSAKTGGLVA